MVEHGGGTQADTMASSPSGWYTCQRGPPTGTIRFSPAGSGGGGSPPPRGTPPSGQGGPALDAAIAAALASPNPGTRLEGEVARLVRADLIAFQRKFGQHGEIGEIDVETTVAVIEVTVRPARRLKTIRKLLTSSVLNPQRKPVVLYAPNYGGYATRDALAAGAHVAHTPAALLALHRQLRGS